MFRVRTPVAEVAMALKMRGEGRGIRASAKQKCWAHIERELKQTETSHMNANRIFAEQVWTIIHQARAVHRQYLEGDITLEQMKAQRPGIETQFERVLDNPPKGGWVY